MRAVVVVRFAIETLLFGLLAMGLMIGVIVAAKQISDEKVRYFVIGYYVAIHNGLVRWIWEKLGIEKKPSA